MIIGVCFCLRRFGVPIIAFLGFLADVWGGAFWCWFFLVLLVVSCFVSGFLIC
jgi:hypothetical protein